MGGLSSSSEYTEKDYIHWEFDENRLHFIAAKGLGETHLRCGTEAGTRPSEIPAFQTAAMPTAVVSIKMLPFVLAYLKRSR